MVPDERHSLQTVDRPWKRLLASCRHRHNQPHRLTPNLECGNAGKWRPGVEDVSPPPNVAAFRISGEHVLQFAHELVQIFELAVNGSEPHIRNFIQLTQF